MHQFKISFLLFCLLFPPLTLFLFKRSLMEIRRDIHPWDFYQIWSQNAHISLLQLPPFIEIEHIIQLFFSVFKESNCLNIPQIGRCIIFFKWVISVYLSCSCTHFDIFIRYFIFMVKYGQFPEMVRGPQAYINNFHRS